MNVVAVFASGDNGRLWYPFQASNTVVLVFLGTTAARFIGLGVWCVSRLVTLFNCCKSTVPWFTLLFRHHHHSRAPGSTFPLWDFFDDAEANVALKVHLHLPFPVVGDGLWGVGIVPSFKTIFTGVPVIVWSGWCVHVLKALDANVSNSHFCSSGMFSRVGAYGNSFGSFGVAVRVIHGHGVSWFTSSVVSCGCVAHEVVGGWGNDLLIMLNCFSAVCDKYRPLALDDMWTICCVTKFPLSFAQGLHQ